MSEILMPVAILCAVADVRAAEVPHKAFDPIDAVRDRRAARGRNGESYRLSAVLIADRCELLCRFGKCFLPTDTFPFGAFCSFRGCSAHGIEDPVRTVNNLGSRSPLHTYGLASRMRGIWFNRKQPVAINRIQCPAAGAAECAIAMDHGCHRACTPDNLLFGLLEERRCELKAVTD